MFTSPSPQSRFFNDGTVTSIGSLGLRTFYLWFQFVFFFFTSIDLKHAYSSVRVCKKDHSGLKFIWKGEIWQFPCLSQGFSSSPRFFTKFLKVPFSHIRALGISTTNYIDDCLLIANSTEKLIDVKYIASTLDQLDFTNNLEKSEFVPVKKRILWFCIKFQG